MDGQQQVVAAIELLREDLNRRHTENVGQLAATDEKVDEAIRRIEDLHKAFPNGDCDGHRRYHEAIIEKLEDRAQFYRDLRTELASKGLWALLVMLAAALWLYLKTKLNS